MVFVAVVGSAQTITLKGKINAKGDVSGVHVINKTQNKFSVSDDLGEFYIYAALNDSIYFSSLQYEPKTIVVDSQSIISETIAVELADRITELDEVVIGTILTGDLKSDLENSGAEAELNFYDLGIPGYTGKQKTQSERRLYEADAGKLVYYYGIAAVINVHKLLNKISGRTKKLKANVRLESQNLCMEQTKAYFSTSLFGDQEIPEELINEFFYYVSDDPKFLELCQSEDDMGMFELLMSKLSAFTTDDVKTQE